MKDTLTAAAIYIGAAAIIIGSIAGWILNIVSLAGMDSIFTGIGILRIVGIFVAPLGVVLGYV